MKKIIFISLIFTTIGIILGTKIYNAKDSLTSVLNEGKIYYFLQEGVYTSREIMEENIKNIDIKAIDYYNDKYYVYVGITKDKEVAKKVKALYENQGYQIYIREMKMSNEEFYGNITQFDLLLNSAKSNSEILTIMEVVLANYEEIIKKQ